MAILQRLNESGGAVMLVFFSLRLMQRGEKGMHERLVEYTIGRRSFSTSTRQADHKSTKPLRRSLNEASRNTGIASSSPYSSQFAGKTIPPTASNLVHSPGTLAVRTVHSSSSRSL
jgi:hypothetical protein